MLTHSERTDLDYSINLGSATRFSVEDVELSSNATLGLFTGTEGQDDQMFFTVQRSQLFKQLSDDLQNLVMDIAGLAWLLNNASAGLQPKVNDLKFHYTILLLGYRLVRFSPLGGARPTSHLENTIHLGLMAFIMTLLRKLDLSITGVSLVSGPIRSAAQEEWDNQRENQELLLWILFIGGVSIFNQVDDIWLIPKILQTSHVLDLHNWEDITRSLRKFSWVSTIHAKAGQALWSRSNLRYRLPARMYP